ncbi:MAG: phosphatidylglycerophosphatase A [Rhodospirillales bacterium]|nr:phosphatidylglycerophosphatase A [Rhodospirillales bacterium]
MKRLAWWIAAGFGLGLARPAPGTVASAAAALAGFVIAMLGTPALAAAAAACCLVGVWAIGAAGIAGDPGFVVIDEIAGMWIALLGAGHGGIAWAAAAFLAFRTLDIAKPGPVGWADRQGGTIGVMADDVIAGAIAAILVWAARSMLA